MTGHDESSVAGRPGNGSPEVGPLRPHDPPAARRRSESGSALVIALLVMVIMTLLGLAFVLAGQTESRIAINQRNRPRSRPLSLSGASVHQGDRLGEHTRSLQRRRIPAGRRDRDPACAGAWPQACL